jgi:glycosyltransferase involved in cell wall biosynthesis
VKVIIGSPVWSLNGVNSFIAKLTRGVAARGIDARILLTGVTYRERKPMPLSEDLPVAHLPIPRFATWKARRDALAEYLESQSPCIYLPNHDFSHSGVTERLSHGIGVVGIVHSDDAQHYDHAARLGSTWDAVVSVSETIGAKVLRIPGISPERASVIPYGVDASAEYPVRHSSDVLRIIYTGRLDSSQKRVLDLLGIASLLTDRGVRFRLTIAGDGPERRRLEEQIRLRKLEQHVRLTGSVANDEIAVILAEHDAFVLASAYEGLPISLLEAMGQGCVPVVSAVASGVPQLVSDGQNGFVIPVGDLHGFARQLRMLHESPSLREKLGREAWQTVARGEYRADIMVDRYADLFQRVSDESARSGFRRTVSPARRRAPLTLRDRFAAPLWRLSPALRAQQGEP